MKDTVHILLKEIDSICRKEEIDYSISGEIAYCLSKGMEIDENLAEASVLMKAENIDRFCEAILKKNPQRKIESMKNNWRFPGFYLRYLDPETSLFSFTDKGQYRWNCIGINIEIASNIHRNGLHNKVLNILQKCCCRLFQIPQNAREKKYMLAFLVYLPFRNPFAASRLFNAWIKQGSGRTKKNDKTRKINLVRRGSYTCDEFDFGNYTNCLIEGDAIRVSDSIYSYIMKAYKKKVPYKGEYLLSSNVVPWAEAQKEFENSNIDIKRLQGQLFRYVAWRKKHYAPMGKKKKYYYNLLFSSGDRVLLWDRYCQENKFKKIEDLYAVKDYESILKETEGYIEKLWFYRSSQIGFCFDPRVLEIVIEALIVQSSLQTYSVVDYHLTCKKLLKVVELVPPHYFDAIDQTLEGKRKNEQDLMQEKTQLYERLENVQAAHESLFKESNGR